MIVKILTKRREALLSFYGKLYQKGKNHPCLLGKTQHKIKLQSGPGKRKDRKDRKDRKRPESKKDKQQK